MVSRHLALAWGLRWVLGMDNSRLLFASLFLAALLACTGCATGSRIVSAELTTGRVETWGPVAPSHQEARALLVDHCQGRFSMRQVTPTPAAVDATANDAKPQLRHYEFACHKDAVFLATNKTHATRNLAN